TPTFTRVSSGSNLSVKFEAMLEYEINAHPNAKV
ncbi:unnamed protein product, partial [Rotaria sordida]